MTVRFFTLTRINTAIDAGSPFAKVFHDFRKLQATKRLNSYHLFAKQEKGASLAQIALKWKAVDPNKKLELKEGYGYNSSSVFWIYGIENSGV